MSGELSGPYAKRNGRPWLDPNHAGFLDYLGAIQAILGIVQNCFPGEWDSDRILRMLEAIARRSLELQKTPEVEAETAIAFCLVDGMDERRKIQRLLNLCDLNAIRAVYEKVQGWQYGLEAKAKVAELPQIAANP